VNAGDFPGTIISSDWFTVVKQAASGLAGGDGPEGWSVSGWEASAAGVPEQGVGLSVWPNPARGAATVTVMPLEPGEVTVTLYDMLGREVRVLASGRLSAGHHEVHLDGVGLPAGVYVVRAVIEEEPGSGTRVLTRAVTLMR
jgi:hypothetical protein